MIDDTIRRIEDKLAFTRITDENRVELTAMLNDLRNELKALSAEDSDRAESVASFAEATSREAVREKNNPELLDISMQGLNKSVQDLESEYPSLVRVVNDICNFLSGMGV